MIAEKPIKKVLLFNDEATFQTFKKYEDILFEAIKELEAIADNSIGRNKIENYKIYLMNPTDYLVNLYWINYGSKNYPEFTDKEKLFFSLSNVSSMRLDELQEKFIKAYNRLGKYAPLINAKGVKSRLNKDDFNRYLNPNKAKHYQALKTFLDASNELKQYDSSGKGMELIRYANCLKFEGLEVVIDNYKFI